MRIRESGFDSTESRFAQVEPVVPYASLLDCVSVNLVALLRYYGASNCYDPFRSEWFFDDDQGKPWPTLRRVAVLSSIRAHTGLAFSRERPPRSEFASCVERILQGGAPVIVHGDAFYLPWLPYYRTEHIHHAFVVDGVEGGGLHVVDAYVIETEWGQAVPTAQTVERERVQRSVWAWSGENSGTITSIRTREECRQPSVVSILQGNSETLIRRRIPRQIQRFAETAERRRDDRAAMKRFVLACWLVARSRALHLTWLRDVATSAKGGPLSSDFVDDFEHNVVSAWSQAASFSYVASRRLQQGRCPGVVSFDLVKRIAAEEERLAAEVRNRLKY